MATASITAFPSSFSTSNSSNPRIPSTLLRSSSCMKTHQEFPQLILSRRDLFNGLGLMPLVLLPAPPSKAREVEVGSYLPPSPMDPSFVVFEASPKDTPALRAGNVQPYKFILPPTWKQLRIANILSGNYCQPKCAEPWVEVKFEDEKQGKIQVVASPLIRLTNKPNATIEDIGSPEKVIASLGPFVTGNTFDPDELLETSVEKLGDQTYYKYVLETPYALTGSHNLARNKTSMATMQCHKPIEQTHNHMESTVVGQKTTTQTCYKANNEHSLTNKVKEMANSACKMFTEHKHQEHHGQNGGNHTHHVAKTRTSVNHESHANAHMHQSAHQGYTATTDKKKKAGHGHRAKLGVAKAHTSVNHESHASGHMHESAYQEPCPNTATAAPTDKKKKEGHGGNCIPGIGEHIKNMKKKKNSKAGKRSDSSSDSSSSCDDESDNKTSGKNKN